MRHARGTPRAGGWVLRSVFDGRRTVEILDEERQHLHPDVNTTARDGCPFVPQANDVLYFERAGDLYSTSR